MVQDCETFLMQRLDTRTKGDISACSTGAVALLSLFLCFPPGDTRQGY